MFGWRAHLVARHLGEGGVELLGDGLELFLLVDKLVLQPVHLLLQLLDGPLAKVGPGLGGLDLLGEELDLLLVVGLFLIGLLLGYLNGWNDIFTDL